MVKCPSCQKTISQIKLVPITGSVSLSEKYKCVAFCCPLCSTAIGGAVDWKAYSSDIANAVSKKLKG